MRKAVLGSFIRSRSPQHERGESVQNMEDKPRKNEELKKVEEASPRLKESHLEEVSRLYNAKTGVGCYGFHPKIFYTLNRGVLGEGGAEWKMAATSLHDDVLLDSEERYE